MAWQGIDMWLPSATSFLHLGYLTLCRPLLCLQPKQASLCTKQGARKSNTHSPPLVVRNWSSLVSRALQHSTTKETPETRSVLHDSVIRRSYSRTQRCILVCTKCSIEVLLIPVRWLARSRQHEHQSLPSSLLLRAKVSSTSVPFEELVILPSRHLDYLISFFLSCGIVIAC